ncbi:sensor histidine kinase [Gordonia sp. TBRC 11910]|uniref:Sensor-like histidine kinase SenX3 n=1 Tax=Gordonia asplenii TaxID=2725283 RepID=A0A848L315_9ACTN|nr:sensor histidine kinase [Gordonia asplenii]
MSLVGQVLILQVVVIALSLIVGFGWRISNVDDDMRDEYAQRAVAVAHAVAGDPDVARLVAANQGTSLDAAALADGELQREAVDVARRTGVLFVVIANRDGIRIAHPDPDELGRRVSTDPDYVLAGHDVAETDRGTLGESVRGKVPVRDASGAVIGFVSVGISTEKVAEATRRDILLTVGLASVALAVGIAGAVLLARRWRRLTLGLQPDELVALVTEQRAVLHALADGVLAVDRDGRMRVINDKARQLLSISAPVGTARADLGLTTRLQQLLDVPQTVPIAATVGDRIVLVSSHRVTVDGRDLGIVMSVIDRTDVENLTRELDAIRSMSEALRAQRHETANRLHVLAGLLRHDHVAEAVDYLDEITGSGSRGTRLTGLDNVDEPHLSAFLDAKAALARERGVVLSLGAQTWVTGVLDDAVAVTTVVGNLIDNALDAAADPASKNGRVDVELLTDADTLWVTVADSGPGVVFDDPDRVFTEGVTSKDGHAVPGGRGMGLALVRQICRRAGGDAWVAQASESELGGAVFVAKLPGALDAE